MTTVNVSITTVAQPLTQGVTAGSFRFQLVGSDGTVVQTQDSTEVSVSFASVAAGTYTVTAVRLDSTGAALSGAVSASVTVPVPATYDAPATITVTLA